MRSHCSLESSVSEGISRHWPVCASKRQPWYVHSTVRPSHVPAESGNARCGQTSRKAKALPAASRPRINGTSSRVEVTSARPRISSLRSAGYQKPHSSSPSILEAVTPEIDWDWLIRTLSAASMIYRTLMLAMGCSSAARRQRRISPLTSDRSVAGELLLVRFQAILGVEKHALRVLLAATSR